MCRKHWYTRLLILVLALTIFLAAVSPSPALAWPYTTDVYFAFWRQNLTGQVVNDATTDFTASQVWPVAGQAYAPETIRPWLWGSFPQAASAVVGNLLRVLYWGTNIEPGAWAQTSAVLLVRRGPGATVIYGQHQWTFDALPVGQQIGMGWRVASTPALIVLPDKPGIVVKDLQFANSPTPVLLEHLTIGGTAGLIWDTPPRPDFTVPPGEAVEVSIPGILDPVAGGRTVVAKGTVEQNGEEMTFLTQFIVTPPVPIGYNTYWLIFTAISLMLAGGYLILRFRKRGKLA